MKRTLGIVLLTLAAAETLVLAGCSSPVDTHNAADVSFATDMIPHHTQAVEMADLALTTATAPAVTTLATQIKAAQEPEIATMSGWLAAWGETVPSGATGTGMGGMDMGGSSTGMMSDDEMAALAAATGAAFDRMWVTMMIEHHTGALQMAATELADGQNPDAQALATSITAGQTAEIATMQQVLTTLPTA